MMSPAAALLICLVVAAGAAADVVPVVDAADDIEAAPSATELPFLDSKDPPLPLNPTQDEQDLNLKTPDKENLTQEVSGNEKLGVLEEDLLTDGLPEGQPGEAAGALLEQPADVELEEQPKEVAGALSEQPADVELEKQPGEAAGALLEQPADVGLEKQPEVKEQPETLDVQDREQGEPQDRSEEEEDDYEQDTESDHHMASAELPEELSPSLHTTQQTPDVLKLHNAEPAADAAAAAAAAAAVGWPASAAEHSSSAAFVASPVSFSVKEGGSLILPCGLRLAAPGNLAAVSWFHSDRLLVSGGLKVSSDGRHQLQADGSLRLTSAVTQDDGMFTCRVYGAGGTVTEMKHHVDVLAQPVARVHAVPALEVITEPAGGVSEVRRGQPATLACWAPGQPTASVTWTKQGGTLPYGESALQGPRLEIGQVDRTHGGTYLCTVIAADNRTAVRSLQLQVNYPPEVTALEPVVYSGEDHQAAIRCQVFAHPPAEVHWRRPSGRPLRSEHHVTTQEGDMFILRLLVEADDLDTYICTASNVFGNGEAAVDLTGRPGQPVMTSPVQGSEPRSYSLSWRAPSVPSLLAYKLLYRQHMAAASRPSGRWQTAWREAVLPLRDDADDADDADGDHRHQYVISDLQPDSEYEARVVAQNRHGWSEPTAGFRFRTAPNSGEESVLLRQNRTRIADDAGGNPASSVRAGAATLLLGAAIALMICL